MRKGEGRGLRVAVVDEAGHEFGLAEVEVGQEGGLVALSLEQHDAVGHIKSAIMTGYPPHGTHLI